MTDHKAECVLFLRKLSASVREGMNLPDAYSQPVADDYCNDLANEIDAEIDRITAAPAASEGEDGRELEREVRYWLDSLPNAVRCHPGGGAESLAQSFAVNASVHTRPAAQASEGEDGAVAFRVKYVQGWSAWKDTRDDIDRATLSDAKARGWPVEYAYTRPAEQVAAPVAWSRQDHITDNDGTPIGMDEPRVVWGAECPDPEEGGWHPLYGSPQSAQVAATPKHDACETCDGQGVVGGFVGQTAEQYVEVYENCPDCAPKHDEGREAMAGWQRMTQAVRKAQLRHVDKHEGDVYHAMQTIAVKYGAPDHGPLTQPVATQPAARRVTDEDRARVAKALFLNDGGAESSWANNPAIRSAYYDEARAALESFAQPAEGVSE